MCPCSTKGQASLVIEAEAQKEVIGQRKRWQRPMWQVSTMVQQLGHFI